MKIKIIWTISIKSTWACVLTLGVPLKKWVLNFTEKILL